MQVYQEGTRFCVEGQGICGSFEDVGVNRKVVVVLLRSLWRLEDGRCLFRVCPTYSTGRQDACPTEIRSLAHSGTGLRPVRETGGDFSHCQVFKSVICILK